MNLEEFKTELQHSSYQEHSRSPIMVIQVEELFELLDEIAIDNDVIDLVSDCSYEVWNVTNNSLIKSCKYKETAEVYMNILASLESKYEIRKISCR